VKKSRIGFAVLAAGLLAAFLVATAFNRSLRIAYHKNRYLAAAENFMLLSHQGPAPTRFQSLKFLVFRMSDGSKHSEMLHHNEALLALGYLQKQEFELTNRFMGVSTNRLNFHQCVTNTIPGLWWGYSSPMSNKIVVTDVPDHLPKWKKFIAEFDR
jgi:hypothetical protein